MIKLITLNLFLVFTTIISAQDASNNATWDETVGFIIKKTKDQSVKSEIILYDTETGGYSFSINTIEYGIMEDTLELTGNYEGEKLVAKINLTKLQKVREIEVIDFDVYMTGNYVNYYSQDISYKTSRFNIIYRDFEEIKRLQKAWIHLTYLAKKRREKERKLSGDKF
jgi:hypothetical protein